MNGRIITKPEDRTWSLRRKIPCILFPAFQLLILALGGTEIVRDRVQSRSSYVQAERNESPFLARALGISFLVSTPRRGLGCRHIFLLFSLPCALRNDHKLGGHLSFCCMGCMYIWLYEICGEWKGKMGGGVSQGLILHFFYCVGGGWRWCVGFWIDKRERGGWMQN